MKKLNKYSYKFFSEELDILRVNSNLSYEKLSMNLNIPTSYLYYIINRKVKPPVKDKIILKVAAYFNLEPSYFLDYRITRIHDHLFKHTKDFSLIEEALKDKIKL